MGPTPDQAVVALAARQDRVVTAAQLRAAGLSRHAIAHRVRRSRLHVVHRGVYAVGMPVAGSERRTLMRAAVLAAGGRAWLADGSAGELWALTPPGGEVWVTVVGSSIRGRPGIRVRRCECLSESDRAWIGGLPVTSPARTILDLAGTLDPSELERVVAQARVRGVVTDRDLSVAIGRAPRRRGARALGALLAQDHGPALTRSEAERRLLALLREAGLAPDATNVRVAGHEVDLFWVDERLVVEIDGYAFHGSRAAFERDRRRDADLVAAGCAVIRVTWRHVAHGPLATVARVAAARAARAGLASAAPALGQEHRGG